MRERNPWLTAAVLAVALLLIGGLFRPLPSAAAGSFSHACLVDVNAGKAADVDAAVAAAGGLRLMGFAARESAAGAAVATFSIVNGATANGGTVMVPVELLPNESAREWYGPDGIRATDGLSIDVGAGTVDVELFYITE